MAHHQAIEGTSEEIIHLFQGGVIAGQMLRVIVGPDEEDLTENLPDPPTAIHDAPLVEQLLLEGLDSGPATPMMLTDWEEIRQEVRSRADRWTGQL